MFPYIIHITNLFISFLYIDICSSSQYRNINSIFIITMDQIFFQELYYFTDYNQGTRILLFYHPSVAIIKNNYVTHQIEVNETLKQKKTFNLTDNGIKKIKRERDREKKELNLNAILVIDQFVGVSTSLNSLPNTTQLNVQLVIMIILHIQSQISRKNLFSFDHCQ